MREKKKFLNVTFKVKRHPDYEGNHQLAEFDLIGGCTFPLGTTEPEMIRESLHRKGLRRRPRPPS